MPGTSSSAAVAASETVVEVVAAVRAGPSRS